MSGSSLKFGTSGLRGLVIDLVGEPTRQWVARFLAHLEQSGQDGGRTLLVGHDLRRSSPAIAQDALDAAAARGWQAVDCGALPTPALALESLRRGVPAVMVTGSHIPDDRNGLKFYRPDGEIDKRDEAAIIALPVPPAPSGATKPVLTEDGLVERYLARAVAFFGAGALAGLRIGVYQHSTVARDLLVDLLGRLGASAKPLGRSDAFLPVDTEAHRPEDVTAIRDWAASGRFDAIVSADGDADRPLVADGRGTILRGDVLGLLTARHLGLTTVATPVTSSSAMETASFLRNVRRTRVGSPFVIAAIVEAVAAGESVVGFEANGGVLLGVDVERDGRRLAALPTRDAVLPIVSALAEIHRTGTPLSQVIEALDAGAAASDRLAEVDMEAARRFIEKLSKDAGYRDEIAASEGGVVSVSDVDGIRMVTRRGSSLHYRPSGNAPELRCYVEAANPEAASLLLAEGLRRASAELARLS